MHSKQAINSELLNAHAQNAKPACPIIRDVEKISGPGPTRSIKITDRFTCTSANVIYCITCTVLHRQNRETTRRPIPCLLDVEKDDKNASKQIARHIHLPNHSTQHMAVCGLSLHQGRTESHQATLEHFFHFGTLNPHGINERFSFNQFLLLFVNLPCTKQ